MKYKITSKSLKKLRPQLRDGYFNELSDLVETKFGSKNELLQVLKDILHIKEYGVLASVLVKEFEDDSLKKSIFRLSSVTFGCVFLLFVGCLWFFLASGSAEKIGDSFGSLNTLFSGLAFAALIVTLFIQREELKQNSEELNLTRQEFREQNKLLKNENFESTFFRLISLHNEIVDSLEFIDEDRAETRKRACFSKYIESLDLSKTGNKSVDVHTLSVPCGVLYTFNYTIIAPSVEHYHKNLYQILLFVDRNSIKGKGKQYTNFIRSQLSRDELHLLFLHCLSVHGKDKFKALVEKYEMLEHLPEDTFLLKENIHLYDKTAFGKNTKLLELYPD